MKDTNIVYGLVLSGGKSSRMGTDKGTIEYHGVPQREYLYHLLEKVCTKAFLSIRPEQQNEIPKNMQTILDRNTFKGPYNGLLSAHEQYPEAAWLVLACDLPLLDLDALAKLILERNPNKLATAYATSESKLPEPLCAIWEPEALQTSIGYLKAGNGTCPRKFLINSDVQLVFPGNEEVLLNANSKEEYEQAFLKITSA